MISAVSIAALIFLFVLPAGAATVTHDFSGRLDGHTGASPINQHEWYDQHGTKHFVTPGDWLDNVYGNYWYYPITMISQDSVVYGPTYQFFATGIACYRTPPSISSIGWDPNRWYNTDINGSYNIQCGNDYKSYFATHRNWNDYIPAGMAVYIDLNKTASYDLAANGRQPEFYLDGTLCLGTTLKAWAGTSYKGVFTPRVGDWSVANINYGSSAAITPNTPVQGVNTVDVLIGDIWGNIAYKEFAFRYDTVAPSAAFYPGSAGWNRSATVWISPSDATSGVGSYVYRVSTDNGNSWGGWSSRIYGSGGTSVTLSTQGTDRIQVQVTDNAGNVGTVTSGQYLIDTTAPAATFSPNSCSWRNSPIGVTLQPTDTGGSGVSSYIYRISTDNGSTWGGWSSRVFGGGSTAVTLSTQGVNLIQVQAIDNAGNVGTATSGQYLLDLTAPGATYSPASSDYVDSATVTITPTDTGGSGVKQWRYRTSDDGTFDTESWSSVFTSAAPQQVTISDPLDTRIQTEVTDNAGNVGTVVSGVYHKKDTGNLTGTLHVSDHYYEDTDVTGAVDISYVNANPNQDLIPASGVKVKITAGSSVVTEDVLCPVNNHSWIPFKFRTPDTGGSDSVPLNIRVEIDSTNALSETNENDNILTQQINVDSTKFTEPAATTYQPTAPSSWQGIQAGDYPSASSYSWQEWRYEGGGLVLKDFSVQASASMQLTPDSRAASSVFDSDSNTWTMRSGYGFGDTTQLHVTTNYDRPELITLPQRIRVYFPEFDYDQVNNFRELEQTGRTGADTDYTVTYAFKQNSQSDILARLHFTPLWFPDGQYVVLENARDLWTPAGQINLWGSGTINISGSVYDDWHASVIPGSN